jgi:hypothetical protein
MPKYLIERTFSDGLFIPFDEKGGKWCAAVVHTNTQHAVTWLHSYVTPDKTKTFCIYDAPSPEAIRKTALSNKLPVESISEVRVLDPYFTPDAVTALPLVPGRPRRSIPSTPGIPDAYLTKSEQHRSHLDRVDSCRVQKPFGTKWKRFTLLGR